MGESGRVLPENHIGLGRICVKDKRDKDHLLTRRTAARGVSSRYWYTPEAYDQFGTAQCVAYAGVRYLASGPVINAPIPFEELYKQCQRLDEFEGEDYEGTSVRALFKALKERELIDEYKWAFTAEPVIDHVLTTGPVVMGTNWTPEMDNPNMWGYITLGDFDDADAAGGHAWCIVGVNRAKRNPDDSLGAVRAVNSRGIRWGDIGRFWVTFKDLARLIEANGEAGVAVEVKR